MTQNLLSNMDLERQVIDTSNLPPGKSSEVPTSRGACFKTFKVSSSSRASLPSVPSSSHTRAPRAGGGRLRSHVPLPWRIANASERVRGLPIGKQCTDTLQDHLRAGELGNSNAHASAAHSTIVHHRVDFEQARASFNCSHNKRRHQPTGRKSPARYGMEASRFLFVLAVALVASRPPTSAFKIIDCTMGRESDATLTSLSVSSCPDTSGERCIFTRGDNSTMTMEFLPTKVFDQANISITAKLGFLPVPFHFQGPTDACGNYGFNCPTKVGEVTHMKFSLPVQRSFPAVKAVVHFEMKDEKARPIVCFEFPVQLK